MRVLLSRLDLLPMVQLVLTVKLQRLPMHHLVQALVSLLLLDQPRLDRYLLVLVTILRVPDVEPLDEADAAKFLSAHEMKLIISRCVCLVAIYATVSWILVYHERHGTA